MASLFMAERRQNRCVPYRLSKAEIHKLSKTVLLAQMPDFRLTISLSPFKNNFVCTAIHF